MNLNSGNPQQVMIRNFYVCLTHNQNLLVILYIVDTILNIYFELFTMSAVIFLASICLHLATVLGQFKEQLIESENSNKSQEQITLEEWKKRYTQMIKTIDDVDSCVSPYTCYTTCVYTYGVMAAIYAVTMFCDETTIVYRVKVVMKALLPLGSLMVCAVTVDCQVHKNEFPSGTDKGWHVY